MGRKVRGGGRRETIPLRPVEKIELSEKHIKLRTVLTFVFLAVGVAAIAYGVSSLLRVDPGWEEIQVTASETHCGGDFTLQYYVGANGSAAAEKRAVSALYSTAAVKAYKLFTCDVEFDEIYNVATINSHPNQEIQVDEGLYRAFSQIRESGDRSLYLGPVYSCYDDLFFCVDDSQAEEFDPLLDPELAKYYAEMAAFANDKKAVDLELLEDNTVRLKVSEEYLAYARENEIDRFIDFNWMKNAFIADFLAQQLLDNGYTNGYLVSYDGFVRNLDESGRKYSLAINNRLGTTIYPAGVLDYTGPAGIVCLRDYGMSEKDLQHYYLYQNGVIRPPYLDVSDGLCKSAREELICYAGDRGCAQVLLEMIPVYVTDSFRETEIGKLRRKGISSVYCRDGKILYNDPSVSLRGLYQGEDVSYQAELLN